MSKKESNYWPHFIFALVVFAITLGVWTVKTAIDNPVEMDNSFMMKYQDVDKNFYNIEKEKKEFDKLYTLELKNRKLDPGKNQIVLFVKERNTSKPLTGAHVEVLLTRPFTTKFDKKSKAHFENGAYITDLNISQEGRWNIIFKISDSNLTRYKTYKLSTRRVMGEKSLNNTEIK